MTHPELVKALKKPGEALLSSQSAQTLDLIHMVMGISGEAGELLDAVKKHSIYEKPLDMENVLEELGDIEFFLEGFRQNLGLTREQCLKGNIEKLEKRYSGGVYTNQAAQQRADKNVPYRKLHAP